MRIYFSTVVRTARPDQGGALMSLEWPAKRISHSVPVIPTDPLLDDPNPRGNTRGGRGIVFHDGGVVVASYHTLLLFDRSLKHQRSITHRLFAGIHELASTADGSVWVAATAIDAALKVDLTSGDVIEERWPREMLGLQRALDVRPLELDKSADNRGRFLSPRHMSAPGHLHLNALAVYQGRLLGLCHAPGAIVDLDEDRIIVRHKGLARAHDLVVRDDGSAIVCDTAAGSVHLFDLRNGSLMRSYDLRDHAWVRHHIRRATLAHSIRQLGARMGMRGLPPARPLFVRGLARDAGRLYVGISPAAVLELDEDDGRLIDAYSHSTDVQQVVHGLRVEPAEMAAD